MKITNNLRLARYRLEFLVETPIDLPVFAGSTIRGAFGHALHKSVCVTKAQTCDGCALLNNCSYINIFEPRPKFKHTIQDFKQIPRPYVVESPDWGERRYAIGETVQFHIVLAGDAVAQLALILWAFNQAFQHGVGKTKGKARLQKVFYVGIDHEQLILDGLHGKIAEHLAYVPPITTNNINSVILHFETPLRLQVNGRRATAEEFTTRRLLIGLIKRIALIHEYHGSEPLEIDFTGLAKQAEQLESEKHLRWREWVRYSSRQNQKMNLGGVTGTWKLSGDIQPFLPFLYLGQWLHVGKEAVFGLGGYRLEIL